MQMTLNFKARMSDVYGSCRELVAARVHQLGKSQKSIAADMDYSPSDLSRKLAQNPDDSRRFTLDDLETYIKVTGDKEPVMYLAEKYLLERDQSVLEKQIEELQQQLAKAKKK